MDIIIYIKMKFIELIIFNIVIGLEKFLRSIEKQGLDAVHVTIVYHEDYDELLLEIKEMAKIIEDNSDLIFLANNFKDIEKAKKKNKTAIFFGFQNCSPIEDDINLVEKVHELGCRFMQLTYNNQSY